MCVKKTTYNGCDNGVCSPTNYTTWVTVVECIELPIGKTNTSSRKEFPLAPIENCHISTPINFRSCAMLLPRKQESCAYVALHRKLQRCGSSTLMPIGSYNP